MSDLKCARMLLDAAKRDVDALRVMYRSGEISDEVFGFHVQQATEKLMKAWIALLGEVYPLTHNIKELLDLLTGWGVAVGPFASMVHYTPYAVEFRYAGVGPDAQPVEREGALALAEALMDRVGRELANVERS